MSNKKVFYRQCRLQKKIDNGVSIQTSYIPEPYCVQGKVLKLRDSDGKWDNGWVVESAGARVDEKLLPDFHKEIKNHRKSTGDSESCY